MGQIFHCWLLACITTALVPSVCTVGFLFCVLHPHLLLKELVFASSAPPVTTTLQAVAW